MKQPMKYSCTIVLLLFFYISVCSQIVNIPDPNFKTVLIDYGVDTNNDGEIQVLEAEALSSLGVYAYGVQDITGIEAFINLVDLRIENGNFEEADISTLVNLQVLNFAKGDLTSLNLQNNTLLEEVNLQFNDINHLDFSNNSLLEILDISYASFIISLDISENSNLKTLEAYSSDLYSLDVTNNTQLERLVLSRTYLLDVDVTNNTNLEILLVDGTNISELDCSNNTLLKYLSIKETDVSTINLENNTELIGLDVSETQLTLLDVSNLNNLNEIKASESQIQTMTLSQNTALESLIIRENELSYLDVSAAPNLDYLDCSKNQLTNLNVFDNILLEWMYANDNQISGIDLSNNVNLITLNLRNNLIENIEVNNSSELRSFDISENFITNIDISSLTHLTTSLSYTSFRLGNNPNLVYINFKNGDNLSYGPSETNQGLENLPNLQMVCVDDVNSNFAQYVQDATTQNVTITDDCPSNSIVGSITYDDENNGCDTDDFSLNNIKVEVSQGTTTYTVYTNTSGSYSFTAQAGNYNVSAVPENQAYFSITPINSTVNFPSNDNSEVIQDFCISENGIYNDLEIIIVPVTEARPGFDSEYKLIYKNKGTSTLSCDLFLQFQEEYVQFVSSSLTPSQQNAGELVWNDAGLIPFETREIDLVMNLNTPTDPSFPLNDGDVLNFIGSIDSSATDETPEDNETQLSQIVVNSFDPNDITCLEGNFIEVEEVGNYVHYLIRFENIGTANAINVKVANQIDLNKFDIESLVPISSSHDMVTKIVDTDEIEFIFEGINLPFNDEDNDGYILYKIRTHPFLLLGDIFTNQAAIYFDFNPPIVTNIATTEIVDSTLNTTNFSDSSTILFYPNPAQDILNIQSSEQLSKVIIYDITGNKVVMFNEVNLKKGFLNLEGIESGFYLVRIETKHQTITKELIKN